MALAVEYHDLPSISHNNPPFFCPSRFVQHSVYRGFPHFGRSCDDLLKVTDVVAVCKIKDIFRAIFRIK